MEKQAAVDLLKCFLEKRKTPDIDCHKELQGLVAYGVAKGCFINPDTLFEEDEWRKFGDILFEEMISENKTAKKLAKPWRAVTNALTIHRVEQKVAAAATERLGKTLRADEEANPYPLPPSVQQFTMKAPGGWGEGARPSAPPLPLETPEGEAAGEGRNKNPFLKDMRLESGGSERAGLWAKIAGEALREGDVGAATELVGAFPVVYSPPDAQGQITVTMTNLDWKILTQLRATVNESGIRGEPTKQMLDYLWSTNVLLPGDIRNIMKLILTQHQILLFNAHWHSACQEAVAVQRQPGDPLYGVTLDELLGVGESITQGLQASQSQVFAALAPLQSGKGPHSSRRPALRCYRCGVAGHMKRQCGTANVWCPSCRSNTHNETACRRKTQGNGKTSGNRRPAMTQKAAFPSTAAAAAETPTETNPFTSNQPPEGAWGLDLATAVNVTLMDNKPVGVKTGVMGPVKINNEPVGALLIGRSSATLNGALVLTGLIDKDFTGEIQIMVSAMFPPLHIPKGTRLAQLVPLPHLTENVPPLHNQPRGSRAFGSTGGMAMLTIGLRQNVTSHTRGFEANSSYCGYNDTTNTTMGAYGNKSSTWPRQTAKALPPGIFLICGDRAWQGIPANAHGGPCYLGRLTLFAPDLHSQELRNITRQWKRRTRRSLKTLGSDCDDQVELWGPAERFFSAALVPGVAVAHAMASLGKLACWAVKQANVTTQILTEMAQDLDSLRHAVLQNRAAIDFLLLAQGHGCEELEGMCCFNLSDHGESIHEQLKWLRDHTKKIVVQNNWLDELFASWFGNMGGWILGLIKEGLRLLLIIALIIVAARVVFSCLTKRLEQLTSKVFLAQNKNGGIVEDWLAARNHVDLVQLQDKEMADYRTQLV
ncbi:uncharacterized protein [Anser cygnoides]|uniref:uncharacterized protein n=1 Tax=Anser cygnoides TaxID=8845 RepID=UPI0034D15500